MMMMGRLKGLRIAVMALACLSFCVTPVLAGNSSSCCKCYCQGVDGRGCLSNCGGCSSTCCCICNTKCCTWTGCCRCKVQNCCKKSECYCNICFLQCCKYICCYSSYCCDPHGNCCYTCGGVAA
jgi:hypothetical protein